MYHCCHEHKINDVAEFKNAFVVKLCSYFQYMLKNY